MPRLRRILGALILTSRVMLERWRSTGRSTSPVLRLGSGVGRGCFDPIAGFGSYRLLVDVAPPPSPTAVWNPSDHQSPKPQHRVEMFV